MQGLGIVVALLVWACAGTASADFFTTSTSWDRNENGIAKISRAEFIEENRDALLQDAARAGGEYLAVYAHLSGVKTEDRDAFYRWVQDHFKDLAKGLREK